MVRSTLGFVVALVTLSTIGCVHRTHPPTTPAEVAPIVGPVMREKALDPPEAIRWAAPPPPEVGLPGADSRVNQDVSLRFQNEPAIAVNPADPQHLVAAWCDNFLFDTGWTLQLTTLAYGWSFDGGQTWQSRRIDFGNIPADVLTADPHVAFDSTGNVYFSILRYDPWDRISAARNQVLIAKSVDGGQNYADPVLVDAGAMDLPWFVTDGTELYVVWKDFGTVYFSRSSDGGATFRPRVSISGATNANGPKAVIGPAGEIYATWLEIDQAVWFDRSLDGGTTWLGTDRQVDLHNKPRDLLVGNFRNVSISTMAVDRSGGAFDGRIYVVWPDGRFGDPDILLSYSADGGVSFSPAIRVNDDAIGNDADQFFPEINVDGNGHVHVTFHDRRNDSDGQEIAFYMTTSIDGGQSFGPNLLVSDGGFTPSNVFYGDYTAITSTAGVIYSSWPDARRVDQDVYVQRIDALDFDQDGVLNDGDADGQYGGDGCTGGQVSGCDDNCPGRPNPDQADGDGDRVGDACDNCVGVVNANQWDVDRDSEGDACDSCPSRVGATAGDPDGDTIDGCIDNCPGDTNATQTDNDGDGLGDACDPCPVSAINDPDGDGLCGDVDNCPVQFNPLQGDTDRDDVGNLCDNCVSAANPAQDDADFDDSGVPCDCQPNEFTDRPPRTLRRLELVRTPTGATLIWTHTTAAVSYSVSRGLLSTLAAGAYGQCLADGVGLDGIDDDDLSPSGDGFFYLVQGWNDMCGLGSLSFASSEIPRINLDASACVGAP